MKHSYTFKLFALLLIFFGLSEVKAQLSVTVSSADVSCNGGNDGVASATASNGTAPYTYLWSNSASTSIVTNLMAGTYTVTVTDALAATAVDSAVINQPTLVQGSATTDSNTTCFASLDGGATVSASGGVAPYAYTWSNAATTASITGIGVGIYTVTITDANGCTGTTNAIINSNDVTPPTAITQNTTVYLDANGQATVLATDIDNGSTDNCSVSSLQILGGSVDCADVNNPKTVRLIAVDSDGNRDTATATVTVLDTISPTVITKDINVTLGADRRATILASDIDSATSDACGIDSLRIDSGLVFNCSNVGMNSVWLYAVDINGNTDSAMATVNVIDTLSKDTIFEVQSACDSYTWPRNNQTYTSSGSYFDTLRNAFGCDSIYYDLLLNIDTAVTIIDTVTACDAYTWRDTVSYTENRGPDSTTFVILRDNGCDSIVYRLNLTINRSDSGLTFQESACGSYTWSQNNQTYSSSGIYTDVLTNADGCDSTITLDLEIRPLNLNVINMSDSLFAFENHPQATYQWYDCRGDSAITGATSRGYKPDTTGFFKVIISNGLCSDTSDCEEVINVGLREGNLKDSELSIYPNPTQNSFFFEVSKLEQNQQLQVFDMQGKLIYQEQINRHKTKIETSNWKQGIYFLNYNGVMKKLVITK